MSTLAAHLFLCLLHESSIRFNQIHYLKPDGITVTTHGLRSISRVGPWTLESHVNFEAPNRTWKLEDEIGKLEMGDQSNSALLFTRTGLTRMEDERNLGSRADLPEAL